MNNSSDRNKAETNNLKGEYMESVVKKIMGVMMIAGLLFTSSYAQAAQDSSEVTESNCCKEEQSKKKSIDAFEFHPFGLDGG